MGRRFRQLNKYKDVITYSIMQDGELHSRVQNRNEAKEIAAKLSGDVVIKKTRDLVTK